MRRPGDTSVSGHGWPINALAAAHALEDAEQGVQVGRGSVVVNGLNDGVRGDDVEFVHGVGFRGCA